MKTLNEVFDEFKYNKDFMWMLSTTDPSDEQIVAFLRAHDCNANVDEAISFLAGLISDVPEDELEETDLAMVAGGRCAYTIEHFM
ncbi:hypothetical protein [Paratractidigestivibacter sp.]|uniref:hypothetical protein n=1 Tax=Paratractidigestivibacter sp. TaxID=2847316 RepID=UPI002ABDC975|nr:hypothetical protein [Paratractidigestivibacter sp.]